jgi:circadian clock protein KaiC
MSLEPRPEQAGEKRLASGIEALDRVLGGFPQGSVVAVAGSPGSGYDLFVQQIMFNAASAGNRVTYLTVDRAPEDIVGDLRSLNLNLDDLIEGQRWNFLNGFEVRMKVRQGELGPKVLLDMLGAVSRAAKAGDWTVVDTLSKILEFNGQKEMTSFVDDILVEAREGRGLHFLLIVEDLHDQRTLTQLAQACDGYVRLSLDRTRSEPSGVIRVEKMRRANAVQRSLNYLIGPEGVTIETATRIL